MSYTPPQISIAEAAGCGCVYGTKSVEYTGSLSVPTASTVYVDVYHDAPENVRIDMIAVSANVAPDTSTVLCIQEAGKNAYWAGYECTSGTSIYRHIFSSKLVINDEVGISIVVDNPSLTTSFTLSYLIRGAVYSTDRNTATPVVISGSVDVAAYSTSDISVCAESDMIVLAAGARPSAGVNVLEIRASPDMPTAIAQSSAPNNPAVSASYTGTMPLPNTKCIDVHVEAGSTAATIYYSVLGVKLG